MNEVFIDIRKENKWIKDHFNTDFVSIENLIACIEDLDCEINYLKEQLEEATKSDEERYEEWKSNRVDALISSGELK